MIKQMSTGAVLSLLLAGAALAMPPAQGGGAGMAQRYHRGANLERLHSELAITSAQEPAWTRFAQALGALRERPSRRAPAPGTGLTPAPQVFAALADRAAAKAKEVRTLSDAVDRLYRVLSPTQRAVLDTHLADFRARHRHQWKRWHRSMQRPGEARPDGG